MLVIKEARSVGPVETMHAHQCVSPALLVTKRSSVAPQRTRRVARGLCSIVASLSQRNAVTGIRSLYSLINVCLLKLMSVSAQPKQAPSTRDTLRLAIPSKGRMAEDTQQLLKVHCAAHFLAKQLSNLPEQTSLFSCRIASCLCTNLILGNTQHRYLW